VAPLFKHAFDLLTAAQWNSTSSCGESAKRVTRVLPKLAALFEIRCAGEIELH
jgi:hypothetical protein